MKTGLADVSHLLHPYILNILMKAEVGSSKSEKETDFSVESTTKANVQTKNKRKLQEIKAEKRTCKEKLQSKEIGIFFTTTNLEKPNDQKSKKET